MIGLGVGLDAFARGDATFGLLGRPGGLPAVMVVAWATNLPWILGLGLLPLVLLLFPDGHLPTPRWRPLAWLILVLAVTLPLEGAVSPGSLQLSPFLDNPVGITGRSLGWLVAVPVTDTISPFGFDSNRLIELLSTWPLYVAIGSRSCASASTTSTGS